MRWRRFLVLLGAVSFAVTSCNLIPDEEDLEPETNTAPEPPTPTFADGDGGLTAVKTMTFQEVPVIGQVEIEVGVGVAVFFDSGNTSSFVEAGSVTLEGESLELQSNNSYVYMPSASSPEGIEFSGNPSWSVGGAGSVSGFTYETNIGFPSVGSITSGETVTKGEPYTLTVTTVSGADSVFFMCGGVIHTLPAGTTSHTFTAAETNGLSSGPSYVQVAPYRIEEATVGGGDYWFVNERVVTQSVTIE